MSDNVEAAATRRMAASAEQVFDAFLDPARIRQWFGPGLGEVTRADVEPRVGGRFTITQKREQGDAVHTGTYLLVERPRLLSFTWETPPSEDSSTVTIALTPLPSGCDATATHEMAAQWGEFKDRAAKAWEAMLAEIDRTDAVT